MAMSTQNTHPASKLYQPQSSIYRLFEKGKRIKTFLVNINSGTIIEHNSTQDVFKTKNKKKQKTKTVFVVLTNFFCFLLAYKDKTSSL